MGRTKEKDVIGVKGRTKEKDVIGVKGRTKEKDVIGVKGRIIIRVKGRIYWDKEKEGSKKL